MSQINPFIGSILQSPAAQRQAAADRDKALRRGINSAKNAYFTEDRVELSVPSADKSEEADDEQKRQREHPKERKPDEDETDRIDVKA